MAIQEIQENDLIKDSREVINENFTELDEGKLSLSGGTMTGPLFMTGANDRIVGFEVKDDGTNFDCGWNHANRDGAGFALRSVDFNGNNNTDQGAFHFWARNATASPELVGKPDGTLTWGGNNVITAAGGTMTGNIKFSSGYISRSTDTAALSLSGGSDNDSGAYLNLYGKSHASSAGAFSLTSYNGTTRKQLVGKLDGTLTWGGSNVITAAGGTMTGDIIIGKSSPHIYMKDTVIARGTAPSATYSPINIACQDKNGKTTWGLYHRYNTDKSNRIDLIVYKGTTTDTTWTGIGVGYDGSGNWFTYAPTPAASSNTTHIATTAWVRTYATPSNIGAAASSHTHSYLPLSGGTLTGAIKGTDNTSIMTICSGSSADAAMGAKLYLYGSNASTYKGWFLIQAGNTSGTYKQLIGKPDGGFTWGGQNIQVSSDKRIKQDFSDVPDDVLDAWGKVDWCRFKYKEDVKEKGVENCRWHTGLVAQDVKEIGEENNVDLCKYGILCYDEWETEYDKDGTLLREEGDLWTVRYTEALAMEVIYLRNEIKKLHEEINKLK